MKLLNLNIDYSKSISYVPKTITNKAIVTYILALIACSVLYMQHALTWYWVLFGLVEVVGFFYFANKFSLEWNSLNNKNFKNRIFWITLLLRSVYVIFAYWFFWEMTGTEWDFEAGDVRGYHQIACYAAEQFRTGKEYNLFVSAQGYWENDLSDTGYATYLSFVYLLSDDSIIFARLLKCIWSAWTAVLLYKLTNRHFGEGVARMTAILFLLMPNFFHYCAVHLKETEMVFLTVLFAERADALMRHQKLTFFSTFIVILIAGLLFTFRTALAAVLMASLLLSLLLSSSKVVSKSKKWVISVFSILFIGLFIWDTVGDSVMSLIEEGGSNQQGNMEWRSNRKDSAGFTQEYAKYAGAAVFAPLIFSIPFPTMVETPGQKHVKMIHGGNFDKNILSFFTIFALFFLLFNGDWRKHVLPISILCGYLFVLIFSPFAQSERFHLPGLPFTLLFASVGISLFKTNLKYKKWFNGWCVFMFVAAIAWNWFKLAGRGMI